MHAYDNFRYNLLNAPWNACYVRNDVNDTVDNWLHLFLQCAEAFIPHYEVTIRPNDKGLMNSYIRSFMCKRDRLYKLCKHTNEASVHTEYGRCRNRVVSEIRNPKLNLIGNRIAICVRVIFLALNGGTYVNVV